jgi:hypothetical protein
MLASLVPTMPPILAPAALSPAAMNGPVPWRAERAPTITTLGELLTVNDEFL